MRIYGIYDLKNKEQVVMVGSILEIINFLNVSARSFDRLIKGALYKERYQVLYVYQEQENRL